MNRWGGVKLQKLVGTSSRFRTPSDPAFEALPWRDACRHEFTARRIIANAMIQENVSPWQAFKMVRRYAIINGLWPTKLNDKEKDNLARQGRTGLK